MRICCDEFQSKSLYIVRVHRNVQIGNFTLLLSFASIPKSNIFPISFDKSIFFKYLHRTKQNNKPRRECFPLKNLKKRNAAPLFPSTEYVADFQKNKQNSSKTALKHLLPHFLMQRHTVPKLIIYIYKIKVNLRLN